MNFHDLKEEAQRAELWLVMAALILFVGVFTLFKQLSGGSSHIETVEDVVYEMPRPVKSEVESEFGLGDREIIRNYIKKPTPNVELKNGKAIAAAPPKKKTAKVAKKKEDEKKKPQVQVNVVGEKDPSQKAGSPESLAPFIAYQPRPPAARKPETPPDEDIKKLRSLEEWRHLLMTQPTRENMDQFVKALRAGEIPAAGFYQVTQEMISTKEKNRQAMALYGVQSVPHVMSFSFLAKNLEQLTVENQPTGRLIMLSYGSPQRLSILSQALQTNDALVATRAAEVITLGLERVKSGQSNDPRLARGHALPQAGAVESYAQFVPFFQQWQQSGDPNLMNLANSFLSRWQS